MGRSTARIPVIAVFGAVGTALFHQIQINAFVASAPSLGTPGYRLQSRVVLAASKAEIAQAEKQAKLLAWAANTAAEQGAPQASAMQAKADQAVRALEALKQQQSGGAPAPAVQPTPAAPAASDTIQRTVMSSPLMVEEIAELEKQVRLLTWAAQTAAEKGMPQAAAAQARAEQAVQQLMQVKEQQETRAGGRSVTSPPVSEVPVPPAAVAAGATPAAASGVSKAEIAEAERHAKLSTWAAKKAAEEGMPQAAAMQVKAEKAVRALEALKEQQASRPAPPVVSVPSVPVAAAPSSSAPSPQEFEQAKKDMNLLMWAAKTAAEKGLPQAAMMKAKADAKALEYERMVEQMDTVRR